MLRPVLVAVLEMKRFLTDRGDLAFSLALPIALFALMYGAFGGGGVSFHGTAHVVDLDGGAAAQRLLSRLDAIDAVSVRHYSLEDADAAMDRAAVATVIVIPAGFTSSLEAG